MIKKIFGWLFIIVAGICFLDVAWIELRKWTVYAGNPPSSNTTAFWIMLILGAVFLMIGGKLLPKSEEQDTDEKD